MVSPWTVACDGSVAYKGNSVTAAWSFVTGAGWADWDVFEGASSTGAEFAAYARDLAVYPSAAPVVLITDSKHGARCLRLLQAPGHAAPASPWLELARRARRQRVGAGRSCYRPPRAMRTCSASRSPANSPGWAAARAARARSSATASRCGDLATTRTGLAAHDARPDLGS